MRGAGRIGASYEGGRLLAHSHFDLFYIRLDLRNGIEAALTPGLTTCNTFDTHPAAFEHTIFFNGLVGELGARGVEPTVTTQTGRDELFVKPDHR